MFQMVRVMVGVIEKEDIESHTGPKLLYCSYLCFYKELCDQIPVTEV